MAIRAADLPADAARPADAAQVLAVRRAALWALLAAKLLAGWGVRWDIQWHVQIGRDSFWIPPHLMTYTGVGLVVLLSFGVLLWETTRAQPSRSLKNASRVARPLAPDRSAPSAGFARATPGGGLGGGLLRAPPRF